MNIAGVSQALYDLIDINKTTLLSGLSVQGNNRTLAILTQSKFTPTSGYYYISINIGESSRYEKSQQEKWPITRYPCELEVADRIFHIAPETNAYEKMSIDFYKLCDRIAQLIYDAKTFTNASFKYELLTSAAPENNRRIDMQIIHSYGEEDQDLFLYGLIKFILVGEFETNI